MLDNVDEYISIEVKNLPDFEIQSIFGDADVEFAPTFEVTKESKVYVNDMNIKDSIS